MARMEQAGKLQCVITANVFNQAIRGGCEHVINLHGTVYENQCPRCGELYTVEDILEMKGILCCRVCNATIRPKVSLFGEMVDSRIMTRTTEEIEKAEVLLLVGTTLRSETFSNYLKYFHGKYLAVLHRTPHYSDEKADLTLIGEPGQILSQLGY
jgi:NAD-dependent deacetylase